MVSHQGRQAPTQIDRSMFVPNERCWVCSSDELRFVLDETIDTMKLVAEVLHEYHGKKFSIVECRRCGFMQPDRLPADPSYFEEFNQHCVSRFVEQPTDFESVLRENFDTTFRDFIYEEIIREMGELVPSGERTALDVGCGVGKFVFRMKEAGWKATGVELDRREARFAAERTGCEISSERLSELIKQGRTFKVVTFLDVLEHIPNPRAILVEAQQLIAPGGFLVIKVPNGKKQLLKEKVKGALFNSTVQISLSFSHSNHFGPKSLDLLLQSVGLEKVLLKTAPPELFPGDSIKHKLGRLGRLLAFRLASSPVIGVRNPLAMNILSVSRKPTN